MIVRFRVIEIVDCRMSNAHIYVACSPTIDDVRRAASMSIICFIEINTAANGVLLFNSNTV